jgi:hypothetical protein
MFTSSYRGKSEAPTLKTVGAFLGIATGAGTSAYFRAHYHAERP